jgi:hypothetical protein
LSEKFRRFVILVSIHQCWIHLSTLSEFAGPLQLMALPPAFDGFVEHSKRVSPTIARQGIAQQCTRGVFDHF